MVKDCKPDGICASLSRGLAPQSLCLLNGGSSRNDGKDEGKGVTKGDAALGLILHSFSVV